jgi:hypothetical protein
LLRPNDVVGQIVRWVIVECSPGNQAAICTAVAGVSDEPRIIQKVQCPIDEAKAATVAIGYVRENLYFPRTSEVRRPS